MQSQNNQQQQAPRIRINHFIRVPEVRVIFDDGSNGGVMKTNEALKLAQEQNLDLIEINPKSSPPVCKITSLGKWRYDQKKKEAETKRNSKQQELKEIMFRPNTDEHDLGHKLEQARLFLKNGDKVKMTCKFRGREITHTELGAEKIKWCLEQLAELIVENPSITSEAKTMYVIVSPTK